MDRSIQFWVFLAVFQIAFGLAVFGLTRHHYLQAPAPSTAAAQTASHGTGAGLPDTPGGSDLEQLMDLFPPQGAEEDAMAILRTADSHFANGQYEQAAQGYARLQKLGVLDVDIYNNLGITLHYLGRTEEAIQVLNDGIKLDSSYQRIWLTSGFVNSQVGNFEQARSAFEQAISIDPSSEVGQAAIQMLNQLGS